MKTFILVLIIIFIAANAFMFAMLCRQTPEEKALEDEEQMEYLKNLNNKNDAEEVTTEERSESVTAETEENKNDCTEADL